MASGRISHDTPALFGRRSALALGALGLGSLGLGALGLGALAGCGSTTTETVTVRSARSPLLGKPAPELAADSLDHGKFTLSAHKGKIVVIDFFAKFCEPCKKTLPALSQIAKQRDDRVVIVGVSQDENEFDCREMATVFDLQFPVIFDGSHDIAHRFQVAELPRTLLVDREGIVKWAGDGKTTDADLRNVVELLAS